MSIIPDLLACKKDEGPERYLHRNQGEHSDFFREVGVKVSEDPDELVAARLSYWTLNS